MELSDTSLGGDAVVALSIQRDTIEELKLKAVVALQPPSYYFNTTNGDDIKIPVFFSLGDADPTLDNPLVKAIYERDPVGPKVLTSHNKIGHYGDTIIGPNHLKGYYVKYFQWLIMGTRNQATTSQSKPRTVSVTM